MKAVTWHGKRDIRVDNVPDPMIQDPTDCIVRITSTAICGSDLHLYEVFGPFLEEGDILGHEPMGIVEEVGPEVRELKVGDRVVIPFNVSCGDCWTCGQGLHSQCETTQNHDQGTGASLFGYTKLYGQVPGGQAELLRVPFADKLPIRVPHGPPDERFLYLSDVMPTAWQGVKYADVPDGGTLLVLGLGPIGDMATRIAMHQGKRVIAIDLVPERLERARANGVEVLDLQTLDNPGDVLREMTDGRGPDAVLEAVGMEAHGSPVAEIAHKFIGLLPDAIAEPMMKQAGIDRMNALYLAFDACRRGGTVSISGVYGGQADPFPLFQIFDKQLQLRMGQANVLAHVDDLLPLVTDSDVLGCEDFATHRIGFDEVPEAYATFQKKQDGAIKYVIKPT
ncbi:MAG: zinc-dependent alcohol dehydrogenase [Solirubrobacteraceae bacterium]